ncbi:MAG: hypothetical protein C0397_11640 [Odoribacter sp.]|nr:hypothetical protein [Odoribacter sp.]
MKKSLLTLSLLILFNLSYAGRPRFSFFCELPNKQFNELFSDSALIGQLFKMQVSVRIGLHDFSPERTLTIQKLNQAGIPIVAWLLLPEEDGYWFNMYNGEKAVKRYAGFKSWTAENQLKWEGIGIDLEPDMNDAKLAVSHPWKMAWKAYKRLYDTHSLKEGKAIYQMLISTMKADGYLVESYIMPYIYEERVKKTTSLQKLLGIIDIETEKEIPMAYTSLFDNPGIIPLYHQDKMPIALGSTGGGVVIEGIELKSMSWDKLERDILIASKLTGEIHIFCLETSVQKGFLTKIESIDFDQKEPDIQRSITKQKKMNGTVRFILIILDHPFLLTLVILALVFTLVWGVYRLGKFILKRLKLV